MKNLTRSKSSPTRRQVLRAKILTYLYRRGLGVQAAKDCYEQWKQEKYGISHLSEWPEEKIEEVIQIVSRKLQR